VEQKQRNYGVDVQAGYFVIDKLAVGLHFFYQYALTESNGIETTSSAINIGPQGTYYLPISDEFYIPLTLCVGFQTTTLDHALQDPFDLTGYGVTIRVRGEYIVDEWLGIRAIFGPQFGSYSNEEQELDVNFLNWNLARAYFFIPKFTQA
jgi:hypothetical protein